jgi:hypothetical protein
MTMLIPLTDRMCDAARRVPDVGGAAMLQGSLDQRSLASRHLLAVTRGLEPRVQWALGSGGRTVLTARIQSVGRDVRRAVRG